MTVKEKLEKENIAINDVRTKLDEMNTNLQLIEEQIRQSQNNKFAIIGAIQVLNQLLLDKAEEAETENNE